MKNLWKVVVLGFRTASLVVSAGFWLAYALRAGHGLGTAWWRVRNLHAGSTATCKRGHVNETTGGVYECALCHARYEGSIWRCGRPSCAAVTPYISCDTCGTAIDSPFLGSSD